MEKSKFPSNCRVVESPTARDLTPDEICRCVTGLSIQQLAAAIIENKDGKYDICWKGSRKGTERCDIGEGASER